VQEVARANANSTRYYELNLAQQQREEFLTQLSEVRTSANQEPVLCLLDEIDARAEESWPYEEVFSILDLNLSEERRVAFVLVGSSPTGL
jgi:hypothetical protein